MKTDSFKEENKVVFYKTSPLKDGQNEYARVLFGKVIAVDYDKEIAKLEQYFIGEVVEFHVPGKYSDWSFYKKLLAAMTNDDHTVVVLDVHNLVSAVEYYTEVKYGDESEEI